MRYFKLIASVLIVFCVIQIAPIVSDASALDDTLITQSSEKRTVLSDKLVQVQTYCSDNKTYQREFREKKTLVETYNSSGTVVGSKILTETYWTKPILIGSGCRIQSYQVNIQ
ncbi:hypothetical protein DVB69_10630 [Sporosarcina sp. BI001-red]|uniref:hypothetical protein n=1 Tax=Sporosarcina sp. BI001-red TaxID=2282866 RepID=UPI000E23E6F1|nr:hypothetical protein [Sporosarcina sp. BI001-red]REB07294.1 hypothetical protein DVB69_10630 [Sporosarcina sp. BI001-red]